MTIYKSPASDKVTGGLDSGENCRIHYTYTDEWGNIWGYLEDEDTDERLYKTYECGWVPMAYLIQGYDGISFEEEFSGQFLPESGELDGSYQGRHIWFWEYPGSETGYRISVGNHTPDYWHTYLDPEGRTWGYAGYYYGWEGYWICLDDPEADFDTLYPDGGPDFSPVEETPPSLPPDPIVPRLATKTRLLSWAAVFILCSVIAVLLTLRVRKRNKKEDSQ